MKAVSPKMKAKKLLTSYDIPKSKHMDLVKLKSIYVVPSAYMYSGGICLPVQISWLQFGAIILHM